MNFIERVKAPTPRFFVTLRNISLAIAAVGAALLTAPVTLPAVIVKIAGYLTVAGSIGTTISQTVTTQEKNDVDEDDGPPQRFAAAFRYLSVRILFFKGVPSGAPFFAWMLMQSPHPSQSAGILKKRLILA